MVDPIYTHRSALLIHTIIIVPYTTPSLITPSHTIPSLSSPLIKQSINQSIRFIFADRVSTIRSRPLKVLPVYTYIERTD